MTVCCIDRDLPNVHIRDHFSPKKDLLEIIEICSQWFIISCSVGYFDQVGRTTAIFTCINWRDGVSRDR